MRLDDAIHAQQKPKQRKSDYGWFSGLVFHPRATLSAILEQNVPVWLAPLLILTLLAVIEAVIYSHLQMTSASNRILEQDFMKNLSPEEQAFQFALMGPPVRPLYVYITPVLYSAGRLWAVWFFFSMIMNLLLTSAGGRSNLVRTQNMTAWVFLPIGLRYLIQIIAMLVSQTAIANRGFSGLITTNPTDPQSYLFTAFLQTLLGSVDIFYLWHATLLVIAVMVGFQLPNKMRAIMLGFAGVVIGLLFMVFSGYFVVLLQSGLGGIFRRVSWYFQLAW